MAFYFILSKVLSLFQRQAYQIKTGECPENFSAPSPDESVLQSPGQHRHHEPSTCHPGTETDFPKFDLYPPMTPNPETRSGATSPMAPPKTESMTPVYHSAVDFDDGYSVPMYYHEKEQYPVSPRPMMRKQYPEPYSLTSHQYLNRCPHCCGPLFALRYPDTTTTITPPSRKLSQKFRPSSSRDDQSQGDLHFGIPGHNRQVNFSPASSSPPKPQSNKRPKSKIPSSSDSINSPHTDDDSYAPSDEEARREVENMLPRYSPQIRKNKSGNANKKGRTTDTPVPKSYASPSQKVCKSKSKRPRSSTLSDSDSDNDLDLLGIQTQTPDPNLVRKTQPKEKEPVKYDGKTDVMDYLNYFMNIVELNGWDYDTQGLQLSTSLMGDALDVLGSLDRKENKDMRSLSKALIRKFAPAGREAQCSYELMNRVLKPTESVTDFCNALKKLARKAYPKFGVPEKIMIDFFKKGLPSQSAQLEIHLRNPETLNEALEIATAVETFEKPKGLGAWMKPKEDHLAPVLTPKPSPAESSSVPKRPQPMSPVPKPAPLTRPHRYNVSDQHAFPEIECFFCKQKGHYRTSCRFYKAKQYRKNALTH